MSIAEFIQAFRCGVNYAKEFIGYIQDIARRDGLTEDEVLADPRIAQLKNDLNLPHSEKMIRLRELLRKRRFPSSYDEPSVSLPERRPASLDTGIVTEKRVSYSPQKGRWLKRCPGTPQHICCNYLVINNMVGCPYNCTYCYLHEYQNKPGITIYNNIDNLLETLTAFFERENKTHFRIGTGEFSDSLALDKQTRVSARLIELFAQQENHLLELKTKSAEVDHLLACRHNGKTVFAWSVNPEKIVQSEERGARSLAERLAAAARGVQAGYKVGFHFDPIIFYPDWKKDYQEVVRQIFAMVKPADIAWISLGALRFPPKMKKLIESKFPQSRITLGELDKGEDGKLRYFKSVRIELFRRMQEFIRHYAPEVYLYLCMESAEVWQGAGITNQAAGLVARYFNFQQKQTGAFGVSYLDS